MALEVRRKRRVSPGRFISTAVVMLALVAQPMYGMMASQVANAAGPRTEVRTAAELIDAAANQNVGNITLRANITLQPSEKLVLSGRSVEVDGKNYTLTMAGDPDGWNGNYVVQAYQNSVTFRDISITGGDAAILANGATVELTGNVNVSGNEWGGVEVSQGENVTSPAILKGTSKLILTNGTEAYGQPTVWTDSANTEVRLSNLTRATHIKNGQNQYYLVAEKASIVATNVTKGTTYGSAQAAIDDANVNDEVQLNQHITLGDTAIKVNETITFDGNGKTITAPTIRGSSGDNKNAAMVVSANGAVIKDLSIESTYMPGTDSAKHGIVVQNNDSIRVTDVVLKNIKIKNATAGVIVNNADVIIDGITTNGSKWYGVGVDKGADLVVQGEANHSEVQAIKNDNTSTSSVVVDNSKYVKFNIGNETKSYYTVGELKLTNSPVYVNKIQSNGQATWTYTGTATLDGFQYREYQNINDANADADGDTASYWTQDKDANVYTQTVGASWTGEKTLYYRVVAIDADGNRSEPTEIGSVIIDKVNPSISVSLDNVLIGKDSQNPVLTVDTNDAFSGIHYSEYKVMDSSENTVLGWKVVSSGDTVDVSGLTDGNYVLRARTYDKAGNKKSGADVTFTINRADQADTDTGTGPEDEDLTKTGNQGDVPKQASKDDSPEQVEEVPLPGAPGANAAPAFAFANVFTLPGETDDDEVANTEVLGAQTERNNGSSNQFAAAVPTADGWKIFGLMWYWWLLIVAAVAGLIWFIAGARRRSQEDAAL